MATNLLLGHAFVDEPAGRNCCDVRVDEDGRQRRCARPAIDHDALKRDARLFAEAKPGSEIEAKARAALIAAVMVEASDG